MAEYGRTVMRPIHAQRVGRPQPSEPASAKRSATMDAQTQELGSVYESPMLAEMGAFADLTRGDPQGPDMEEFGFYCRVC
ncbi:MAG: lasso RiPP family leader peptide-containing protein [Egibacteraceae bacterium]